MDQEIVFKQCGALAVQETAFVGGFSAADLLANQMKLMFGDNKAVEYSAALISGAGGSLAGHFANTAVTRWQNNLPVESFRQLWWGAFKKHALSLFFRSSINWGKTRSTLQSHANRS